MKNLDPEKEIHGFFISLSEEEKEKIFSMLEEDGYNTDSDGIKKFLLDQTETEENFVHDIKEESTEKILGTVNSYLNEHPEIVVQAKSLMQNVSKAISNKIKKSRDK